jgi:hypothetical protein
MKILIKQDERYPEYCISEKLCNDSRYNSEVSDAIVAYWKQVIAEFNEVQSEMQEVYKREMCKRNGWDYKK